MLETSYIGRLTHPALALGAWLDAVGGYPGCCCLLLLLFFFVWFVCLFSHSFMTLYQQSMSLFGSRPMQGRGRYANGNVSVGDAHSRNGLGVVILRGNLGSCSLSWTTKSSLWCGRKRDGEKGKGGGERMRVAEKWSTTRVISLKSPAFPPVVIIPSGLWGLEKKKIGMYAGSRYAENCCAVRKLSMKVYNWVILSVEFGSEALGGIAKYLCASWCGLV